MPPTTHAADTIFALSSGQGRAGVAVVRISGAASRAVLIAMAGGCPKPRYASLRFIRDPATAEIIDQALVLYFAGPRSETGEDIAELHLHGSRAVLAGVFRVLGAMAGLRPAEPGEFARRAFLNGRIDLTAVEGLADLIDAETDMQRRQALSSARGELARQYEAWRADLIGAMGLIEAAIDFSDESDVAANALGQATGIVTQLDGSVRAHVAGGTRAEIIRDGYRVVLAGAPNVGKSSLLNAIARRDVAIVSPEPGTTRDVIEVRLDLDGLPVVLMDTAGLRETTGAVEQEGIRRTLARARDADLVLFIDDAQDLRGWTRHEELHGIEFANKVWWIANKADLAHGTPNPGPGYVSAATGQGIDELLAGIARRGATATASGGALVPATERQRAALARVIGHLDAFLDGDPDQLEVRAEDLRLAAHALATLTGRVDAEDVLGQIFSRFCIGK